VSAVRVDRSDGASFPFWSPDGRSLGFFAEGFLKTIELRGGPPKPLCPVAYLSGGTWTKDGIIVYAPAVLGVLYRVPATGGAWAPLTTLRPGDLDHRRPSALPDGRVLFSGYRANVALVVDVNTGRLTELRRPGRDAQFAAPDWILFRDEENGPLYAQRFDLRTLRVRGERRIVVDRITSVAARSLPSAFGAFAVVSRALVFSP